MSDLDEFEYSDRYEALATEAARAGGFAHAHVLRTLARSINHLVRREEHILNLAWPTNAGRHPYFAAPTYWRRVWNGQLRTPKQPQHRHADVYIRARLPDENRVFVHVETLAQPALTTLSSARSRTIVGSNLWETYALEDVLLSSSDFERFGLMFRGDPLTDQADDADGGWIDGGVISFDANGVINVAGVTGAAWDNGFAMNHALRIYDGVENQDIYIGQIITAYDETAVLWPRPTQAQIDDANAGFLAVFFEVHPLPLIELGSIDVIARR